jgi:hypothetical protein
MNNHYFKPLLTLLFLIALSLSWSVITDYGFTSSTGAAYTEITTGTTHGTALNDNEVFNDIPLGFDFDYNGTVYTSISIACNGFIAMGPTIASANLAISAGTTNNVVVPFNRDLKSRDTGTLMTNLSGAAPNRVFTVQWHHYKRYPTSATNDTINFQIILNETTNAITFNYGHMYIVTVTTAATVQVGMRGATNTEYVNRMTTTDWTATTPGIANNSNCTINATVFPPNGLIFTWTPPQAGTPPLCAQIVSPANGASNISGSANLHWLSGGGAPTGYKVYLGTDNPPTNLVNGILQTETTYDPIADFTYSTAYYWQIVPTNAFGDAVGCPVWSFTSMSDPTVTTYPYTQNWDSVPAPAVIPSWTVINANADNFTWISVATGANSAPNTLRCSYNSASAVAMNDWVISPPLQLAAGPFYKVQFYYKAQSATYPEKLEIRYGTANTVAAMTQQIYLNENIINTTFTMGEVFLPAVAGGIYYIGFHGFSNPNMYHLFLDDITISEIVPVFNPPTNLTATFTASTVLLSWQAPVGSTPAGYKMYRDGTLLNPSLITGLTYTDNTAAGGMHNYYVTAAYTGPNGESNPSNTVSGELFIPVSNLQYTVAQHDVSLTWTPPTGMIYQDWIHYDDGINYDAVGTNAALNFDVAARWTQTELSGITDRYITKVKFYPYEDSCAYAVKVWTGGNSPTNPGTLVLTLPVPNPVIDAWNEVTLPSAIQIPSVGELWIGINCNTQTSFPAGCDDGPSIPYKGNLIYVDNAWTILTELNDQLDYNWNIQAFATNYLGREAVLTQTAVSLDAKPYQTVSAPVFKAAGIARPNRPTANLENQRPLTGYKVWRDGEVIATINDITVSHYTDPNLPNGSYVYEVTAVYSTGDSAPCPFVIATVFVPIVPTIFQDSFETYTNFATSFIPWMLLDVDQSATVDFPEFNFAGEGSPMAFLIFTPSATTPPMADATGHTGIKMAVCPAATTPPNNDWLITPRMHLGTENSISFWAMSADAQGTLERFKVGISTADNPTPLSFTLLSGPNYIEPPADWTLYTYAVPTAFNAQYARFGIKCESVSATALLIDDVKIQGYNGTGLGGEIVPITATALLGNYPNPFTSSTGISYNVKQEGAVRLEIYNLKGQLVKTLFNGKAKSGSYQLTWNGDDAKGQAVSAGVYFYKMQAGSYTSTRKMVLVK